MELKYVIQVDIERCWHIFLRILENRKISHGQQNNLEETNENTYTTGETENKPES